MTAGRTITGEAVGTPAAIARAWLIEFEGVAQ
jgi:hypothetical protein